MLNASGSVGTSAIVGVLLLGAVVVLSEACSTPLTAPTTSAQPTLSDLQSAPQNVVLAGKTLRLDAYVYLALFGDGLRDGITAVLYVKTSDDSTVPLTVSADTVWVVFGTSVWSTAAEADASRALFAPEYRVLAPRGPRWGPDVLVDVIVRLAESSRGIPVLLRAPSRRITGTI